MSPTTSTTQKRWLPQWVLRLLGYSSLAAALISVAIFLYKRFPPSSRPPRRAVGSGERQAPTTWSARLLRGSKKKMTLSLKNTVLWNPSSDVDTPNHAFQEKAVAMITRLAQLYDIYTIIHINSDEERDQIFELLTKAGLMDVLDNRKILQCSTEEGKIHMIRHIEPHVHIEGGWELDDGEDIVRKLRPFVAKLVWVITRRRRSSFNQARLKESDQGILGPNVELTEKLLDTSFAREVGYNPEE